MSHNFLTILNWTSNALLSCKSLKGAFTLLIWELHELNSRSFMASVLLQIMLVSILYFLNDINNNGIHSLLNCELNVSVNAFKQTFKNYVLCLCFFFQRFKQSSKNISLFFNVLCIMFSKERKKDSCQIVLFVSPLLGSPKTEADLVFMLFLDFMRINSLSKHGVIVLHEEFY